ncbi:hypothetical protein Plhal304r1_c004g0018301 [Plasmopara halstedii]
MTLQSMPDTFFEHIGVLLLSRPKSRRNLICDIYRFHSFPAVASAAEASQLGLYGARFVVRSCTQLMQAYETYRHLRF